MAYGVYVGQVLARLLVIVGSFTRFSASGCPILLGMWRFSIDVQRRSPATADSTG